MVDDRLGVWVGLAIVALRESVELIAIRMPVVRDP
jgi:hypothetical protein